MNILPVAAELLHADTQTDRHDEGNNHVSQFFKLAKKKIILDGAGVWSMYIGVHVQMSKCSVKVTSIFFVHFLLKRVY